MLKRITSAIRTWVHRITLAEDIDQLRCAVQHLHGKIDDPRSYAVPSNLHNRLSAIEASLRAIEGRLTLIEGLPFKVDGGEITTIGRSAKAQGDKAVAETLKRYAESAASARGMTVDEYVRMRRERAPEVPMSTDNKSR